MKLVLVINANGIELAQYRRRWRGWQRLRTQAVTWDEGMADATLGEQLAATLRPQLLAWGVAPGTTVLAAPNTGIGGVLTTSFKPGEAVAAQADQLLSARLPHARAELAACTRLQGTAPHQTLAVAWLPQGWLNELRDALARLGLRLDEAYPLAFLLPHALPKARTGRQLWLTQSGTLLSLWSLPQGLAADGCAVLDTSLPNLPQRLTLAAYGLNEDRDAAGTWLASGLDDTTTAAATAIANSPIEPIAWPTLTEQTFAAWIKGEEGWWLAPPREWLIARFSPWLIGAAVVLIAVLAGMSWQRQRLADETTHLDAAADRLRPNHRRLEAKERELLRLRSQMIDAEVFGKHKGGLDALAAVTAVLPPDAWVTGYHFSKDGYRLDGKGVPAAVLLKPLATAGWIAAPIPPTAKPAGHAEEPIAGNTQAPKAEPAAKASPAKPGAVPPQNTAPTEFSLELHERPAPSKRSSR